MLDPTALEPLLPDTSEAFKGKVARTRDKYSFTETVTLVSGVGLSAKQGGCVHYGVTYEFSNVAETTPATGSRRYHE